MVSPPARNCPEITPPPASRPTTTTQPRRVESSAKTTGRRTESPRCTGATGIASRATLTTGSAGVLLNSVSRVHHTPDVPVTITYSALDATAMTCSAKNAALRRSCASWESWRSVVASLGGDVSTGVEYSCDRAMRPAVSTTTAMPASVATYRRLTSLAARRSSREPRSSGRFRVALSGW